jgi:ParB/RepB/Spo0J family partition protein
MNTQEFTGNPERIPLQQIEPSPDNPRGDVEKDASFDRLVSSISEVGDVLVPIVVRRLGPKKYQLVDGERRFLAARQLRKEDIPAHVISHTVGASDLRKWMFHLHMTREQWGALAQCRSRNIS